MSQLSIGLTVQKNPTFHFDSNPYKYSTLRIGGIGHIDLGKQMQLSGNYFNRISLVPEISYKNIYYSFTYFYTTSEIPFDIRKRPDFYIQDFNYDESLLQTAKHTIGYKSTLLDRLHLRVNANYYNFNEIQYYYFVENHLQQGKREFDYSAFGLGVNVGLIILDDLKIIGSFDRFWGIGHNADHGLSYTAGLHYSFTVK